MEIIWGGPVLYTFIGDSRVVSAHFSVFFVFLEGSTFSNDIERFLAVHNFQNNSRSCSECGWRRDRFRRWFGPDSDRTESDENPRLQPDNVDPDWTESDEDPLYHPELWDALSCPVLVLWCVWSWVWKERRRRKIVDDWFVRFNLVWIYRVRRWCFFGGVQRILI